MRFFTFLIALFACVHLSAQIPQNGLVAYYSCDNCDAMTDMDNPLLIDDSGNNSNGIISGNPTCECGVLGNAIKLDGFDDHVIFLGTINNFFDKRDFSLSFYFKPTDQSSTKDIFSRRTACDNEQVFAVRYTPMSSLVTAELIENPSKTGTVSSQIEFGTCWQHVVVTRQGNRTVLYLNGEKKQTTTAVSRVDIENNVIFSIANSPCLGLTDSPFAGLLDEIRVYDRALDENEVEGLYFGPDKIAEDKNIQVYLGNTAELATTSSCATQFKWEPDIEINQTDAPTAIISPTESRTYRVSFIDVENGCVAFDSVTVTVIDPDDLDCAQIFLPKAFTPDEKGPEENNTYGISNPIAIEELISFEIFDRWGNRVFLTTDAYETWDGSYKGQPMNPGVLLYRVRFKCGDEELVDVGSLSIIR
ncbi:MAG: LamG-like jellyroll fold domain-containing protein [Saprospiraceae bacterium]